PAVLVRHTSATAVGQPRAGSGHVEVRSPPRPLPVARDVVPAPPWVPTQQKACGRRLIWVVRAVAGDRGVGAPMNFPVEADPTSD
ncbi:hypothetical protein, partial [Solicola sp. PLA-1-18]|uniref:hypothetical protein n=1 Tax=Solicola sp. PLA-1-18 TaxID=3380532 RepID=UPI003B8098D0